ncbi:MAG TPA: hypothetical protein VFA52_01710 [Candidatus Paceibacterota bacterium]|nr:hypothetical protein [Candidatus Paceibacterota bacterium]
MLEKIKNASLVRYLAIFGVGTLFLSDAFGLGRLSLLLHQKEPIAIEGYLPEAVSASLSLLAGSPASPATLSTSSASTKSTRSAVPKSSETAIFVASKTGQAYYFPWCGIVKRIKPENQITFHSKEEAEKAGYHAGNCAGLK